MNEIAIIGAGLAGAECALILAKANIKVTIFEQKPTKMSEAHTNNNYAELVCSNSFRNNELGSAIGLLKEELRLLNSPLMAIADKVQVKAGKALAVDRDEFAKEVTKELNAQPNIKIINQEICDLQDSELKKYSKVIIAAGPMASQSLTSSLADILGEKNLYFYDAIAPIISAESIDYSIVFRASRYDENVEEGDYLNCPFSKDEYQIFYDALLVGERVQAHNFEKEIHFEACMPIEALADRGYKTLLFGSLKPVGMVDPRDNRRPYAVLQLRAENIHNTAYNLVGCQTKLTYKAQDEVFRLVPGLKNVEFLRYGSMHRNTYVNAPLVLNDFELKKLANTYLIGQMSGVEGYVESIASGTYLAKKIINPNLAELPVTSALGSLLNHLKTPTKNFQPSNVNFGLMPELSEKTHKKERKEKLATRTLNDFNMWHKEIN